MLLTPHVRSLIALALEEDLGGGDITSELTIASDHQSKAVLEVREESVVCGTPLIPALFESMGWSAEWRCDLSDGQLAPPGGVIGELQGKTTELLALERTLLNFLQRLSGIATGTRRMVEAAKGLVVLDTRKTTPGWRALEKYAVRIGGGRNHRFSLGDMVLVKDNHIDANGGSIETTLRKVAAHKPFYVPVEVEVRNEYELRAALQCGVDVVMLDNMNDTELAQSIEIVASIAPEVKVEVSGGITSERFDALRKAGVTCISAGALTNKAVSVDIGMSIVALQKGS